MATPKVKLGKFFQDEHGALHGTISGLGIGSTTVISQQATDREGHSYLKLIADPLGAAYEVGAAFPKEKDGMSYYSVNLESPLLPAPLNAALFHDNENVTILNLVWSRPDIQRGAEAQFHTSPPQQRRMMGAGATP